MGLILFVALIVLAFLLLGAFVVKWLFILAVVFALIWAIGFFARGAEARWYRW